MTKKTDVALADHLTNDRTNLLQADWAQFYNICEGSRTRRLFSSAQAPDAHAVTALRFDQWTANLVAPLRWLLTPVYVLLNKLIQYYRAVDFLLVQRQSSDATILFHKG